MVLSDEKKLKVEFAKSMAATAALRQRKNAISASLGKHLVALQEAMYAVDDDEDGTDLFDRMMELKAFGDPNERRKEMAKFRGVSGGKASKKKQKEKEEEKFEKRPANKKRKRSMKEEDDAECSSDDVNDKAVDEGLAWSSDEWDKWIE